MLLLPLVSPQGSSSNPD
ncbi:hypothetical protein LINPERPRIM_LOCUS3402 [Linum perenne]